MIIRDRKIKQSVEVAEKICPKLKCYWPRPDPGSFMQGRGYTSRPGPRKWLCGTRQAHGCPYPPCDACGKPFAASGSKCPHCGAER